MTKKALPARAKNTVNRVLNCIPSRNIDTDWGIENAREAGALAVQAPPASKDLRAAWWDIGDQGATGSCVGWSTVDAVIRWHMVKAGKIKPTERLSVRYAWMAAKETDEFTDRPTTFIEVAGTSIKAALDAVRKYGIVRDVDLPFAPPTLYQRDPDTFYALAAQMRIQSYFSLGTNQASWRDWIVNHGPIATRLDVDKTWDNAKVTGGNLDVYQPGTTRGGHAVAIVGYTKDRFIVRNSWGTKLWGDDGFGYASLAYAQAAFTEAYGVIV